MSLVTEMNATVSNILATRETRKRALHDIRNDTKQILTDAKTLLQDCKKESGRRKEDTVKRANDVKEFLKSSTKNRTDDFTSMMKTINGCLKDIKDGVLDIETAAKKMISLYHEERMEAAKSWASLSKPLKISRVEEAGEGVKFKKSKISH